jgi:hypothetical protein
LFEITPESGIPWVWPQISLPYQRFILAAENRGGIDQLRRITAQDPLKIRNKPVFSIHLDRQRINFDRQFIQLPVRLKLGVPGVKPLGQYGFHQKEAYQQNGHKQND